jgi:hypothetical protein
MGPADGPRRGVCAEFTVPGYLYRLPEEAGDTAGDADKTDALLGGLLPGCAYFAYRWINRRRTKEKADKDDRSVEYVGRKREQVRWEPARSGYCACCAAPEYVDFDRIWEGFGGGFGRGRGFLGAGIAVGAPAGLISVTLKSEQYNASLSFSFMIKRLFFFGGISILFTVSAVMGLGVHRHKQQSAKICTYSAFTVSLADKPYAGEMKAF